MTTGTTVIGLVPLTGWLAGVPYLSALGGGVGAEIRAPMAVTVIGGLLTSTLLTLVFVPAAYAAVDDARGRLARAGRRPFALTMNPALQSRLRRRGARSLRVTVSVSIRDAAGQTRTTRRAVRVLI
jgi:hypothetical protein